MANTNSDYSFLDWNIPSRYLLKKVIGTGAYGTVMLA